MAQDNMARRQILDDLRHRLNDLQSSCRSSMSEADNIRPSGIGPLNPLLPGGGLRQGTIVEWLAEDEGAGAVMLAFLAARPLLADGRTCVVIDDKDEFYPLCLAALGIELEQLLIVRPSPKNMLWALEQALRCPGVAVTVGWLGPQPNRVLRRLQLATEAGGGVGFFFRPAEVRAQPAWCQLRLLVTARPSVEAENRRCRMEVLYCQGGKSGGVVEVEVHDETGDVHMVPSLASARDARQAT